jgi:hypothetical protein
VIIFEVGRRELWKIENAFPERGWFPRFKLTSARLKDRAPSGALNLQGYALINQDALSTSQYLERNIYNLGTFSTTPRIMELADGKRDVVDPEVRAYVSSLVTAVSTIDCSLLEFS